MKIFFLLTAIQFLAINALAQEWVVPGERKGRLSPFRFDDITRLSGEKIYTLNCKSCHGTPGKGDFQANLVPQPTDPAGEKLQKNLDGELYYKISTGRGPMPSFRNSLTSAELWNVISFLRSFNKDYIQEIMPLIKSSAYPGAEIVMKLVNDPLAGSVTVLASAVSPEKIVPVSGAAIKLYAGRTFGRIEMDEEKTTDNAGKAIFLIPEDFPGDTSGNLKLTAQFSDEVAFGSQGKDTVLKAGTPVVPISLTAMPSMWNVVRKAPLWIALTYALGVLGVWAFIFIIMLKLRDIFIIGKYLDTSESLKE
jgi:mono/diheme cytochrome c family protein